MDAQNRRDRFESLADEPDLSRRRLVAEQEDLLLALDRARLERRRAQSEAPLPPEP